MKARPFLTFYALQNPVHTPCGNPECKEDHMSTHVLRLDLLTETGISIPLAAGLASTEGRDMVDLGILGTAFSTFGETITILGKKFEDARLSQHDALDAPPPPADIAAKADA